MNKYSNYKKKQQGGNIDIASINQGTGIQFNQDFANQYFRQDTYTPPPQSQVDYMSLPIQDITSNGQWSDRKVWRTQRPEWFLGKKEPVEGVDYNVVPYSQWGTYQNSPEYQTYNNNKLQQGGAWNPSPYATTYPSMFNNFSQQSPYIGRPAPNMEPGFTEPNFPTTSFQNDPRTTTQQLGSGYQFSDEMPAGTSNPISNPQKQYNDITRYNVINPYGGIDLESSLTYAGQGFGSGNYRQAGLGTGLSVLKGARNFLTGYASGKESQRVKNEMYDNLYNPSINYTYLQEGGTIKNSELLTGQYLVDQGYGNVNLENNEYVKRNDTGDVQLVVGDAHIKNGKVGEGVDAFLQDGDKVLSNYTKIPPKNAKELKERYGLSLKKNATFADAQKAYDKKIGIDKITNDLSDYIEKFGKNSQTQDPVAKRLNDSVLSKEIEATQLKLDNLKEPQSLVFEELFQLQESIPKKGNPGELLDKNGKVIEETKIVAQQGGKIEEIAKKYGIPLERANELAKMQQGGEMAQEQSSQQDQIFQFVAQSLQQGADPQQILEQLIQNGVPQDVATQLIQGVMQQLQQPEQTSAPEQEIVQDEMVAQQGGEKRYMQQAGQQELVYDVNTGRNTYRTSPRVNQSATEGKAYGVSDPQIALQNLYNNFPDLIASEFKDNITVDDLGNVDFKKNIPLNKEQEIVRNFQKKADSRMRASAKTIIDNPKNFSPQMVEESKRYLQDETFLDKASDSNEAALKIRAFDSKLGNFTSGRYSLGLNLLTPEDLATAQKSGIKTFKQLKQSPLYDKLSEESKKRTAKVDSLIGNTDADFTISEVKVSPQTNEIIATDTTIPVETRNITKNVIPFLPQDLRLAPSALDPIAKEQIALGRIQPIKTTVEPYLASAESQRQSDVARVQQSGLSPVQQEALLAQGLASSQLSANDAIAKTEQFNAQNQYTTDQFNIGQAAKEMITNAQFNQQYEQRMLQGLANQERDWRAFYTEGNLQNRQNFKDLENLNLINSQQSNYQYVPGMGVQFINARPTSLPVTPTLTQAEIDRLTPEQYNSYIRTQTARMNDVPSKYIKLKNNLYNLDGK